MKTPRHRLILTLLLLLPCACTCADTLERDRTAFLEARQALAAGDMERFTQLAALLRDYPLYPYLRYDLLRTRLDDTPGADLQSFVDDYADTPPGERLRTAWLHQLAERADWSRYLEVYRAPQEPELACYEAQALLNTKGVTEAVLDRAEQLWKVGHSQPEACDPVFVKLYQSPRMTKTLLWERVRLAMAEGQLQLAGFIAQRLDESDRTWVERWKHMYERPALMLENADYREDVPIAREILVFGLRRVARGSAETARVRWQQLRKEHDFSPADVARVERSIALTAAYQRNPQAQAWLSALPAAAVDKPVREWRVRSALLAQDWEAALNWLAKLEPDDMDAYERRYWQARALEALGRSAQAKPLYLELSGERSYHGFLAADRLHSPYQLNEQPIEYQQQELDRLLAKPGIQRARELYRLELTTDARREWSVATAKMTPRELQLAAILAARWGWHDRAILTLAQTRQWDDLDLRFPTAYRDVVLSNARQQHVDPSWVYGVLRQESAFMTDARSRAGALGLMQLMPATARHTARLFNLQPVRATALLEPAPNIRIGTAYLRHVLDRFAGNQVLATAAYNAGPGRVQQWLPDGLTIPTDLWVDTLPFSETRRYVQNVMAYATVYNLRLQRPDLALHKRMGDVVAGLQ